MKHLFAALLAVLLAVVLVLISKHFANRDLAQQRSPIARHDPRADPHPIPGFEQLLPRGRLASIDDPQYVSAKSAKLDDDAFVFGLIVEGQPLAYSLNLLNSHEVVNGNVGETNFAAVW